MYTIQTVNDEYSKLLPQYTRPVQGTLLQLANRCTSLPNFRNDLLRVE